MSKNRLLLVATGLLGLVAAYLFKALPAKTPSYDLEVYLSTTCLGRIVPQGGRTVHQYYLRIEIRSEGPRDPREMRWSYPDTPETVPEILKFVEHWLEFNFAGYSVRPPRVVHMLLSRTAPLAPQGVDRDHFVIQGCAGKSLEKFRELAAWRWTG
jgi:hypothetical protein